MTNREQGVATAQARHEAHAALPHTDCRKWRCAIHDDAHAQETKTPTTFFRPERIPSLKPKELGWFKKNLREQSGVCRRPACAVHEDVTYINHSVRRREKKLRNWKPPRRRGGRRHRKRRRRK